MTNYSEWLAVAESLAEEASRAVLGFLNGPFETRHKSDNSPVTEADLASDRILRAGLAREFPSHAVLTEENGLTGKADSEFVWLIDPLDGTKAFAKGIPGFCVMVGLLKAGKPMLGVVVDPLEGRRYSGIRGEGANHTQKGLTEPLHVSSRSEPSDMPLVVSTGFPQKPMEELRTYIPGPLLDPINSVGIKVGLLVRQLADVYVNHHPVSYWDTCAPLVILEEAGGVFTALDGNPLDYTLRPPYGHGVKTLASNGLRHREFVEALKHVPV